MKRTRSIAALYPVVFMLAAFGTQTHAQTAADNYWWHYVLNQSQRDAYILSKAQSFADNFWANATCKTWIQQMVVPPASKYVAHIPLNNPYCDWMWQWGADVEAVATDRWDGIPWPPGQIIQAQVRTATGGTSPHTMIIQWASPSGASFIECNWKGDGQVRRRYADWATLKNQIIHYTLYRVK